MRTKASQQKFNPVQRDHGTVDGQLSLGFHTSLKSVKLSLSHPALNKCLIDYLFIGFVQIFVFIFCYLPFTLVFDFVLKIFILFDCFLQLCPFTYPFPST